jgi:uncharacterized protein (TIGR03067 family)
MQAPKPAKRGVTLAGALVVPVLLPDPLVSLSSTAAMGYSNLRLVVKDDKYTVTVGKAVDQWTINLNPATPKEMDITGTDGPNKGKTILAISEQDGDTLRVCYDLGSMGRPTEFKTKDGTQLFLVTYKREKP